MQDRLRALLVSHLRGPSQSPKPSSDEGITLGPGPNQLPVEVAAKLHRVCWGRGGSGAQEPVPTWQAAKCHESSPLPSSAGGGMGGYLLGTHGASGHLTCLSLVPACTLDLRYRWSRTHIFPWDEGHREGQVGL